MKLSSFLYQGQKISISFGLVITLLFITIYPSYSMVYYVDEKGVVHFVEDETLIPEKYKSQQHEIEGIKKPSEVSEPNDSVIKENKGQGIQKSVVKDKFGNTPAYWRERYKNLQAEKLAKEKELRELEDQRDQLAKHYESVRSRAYFIGDSQSVTEAANLELRVRELENTIKITIRQLDEINRKISVDIYDEIIQAGGSTSWLISGE